MEVFFDAALANRILHPARGGIDTFTRECLAIEVGNSLANYDVTRVLARL